MVPQRRLMKMCMLKRARLGLHNRRRTFATASASAFKNASGMPTTSIQEQHQNADEPWSQDHMANALRPYFESQQPVVLREAVATTKACKEWNDWSYLQDVLNEDTVCHVEIGGSYASSERSDIRLGDYLAYLQFFEERFERSGPTFPPSENLVYMAQNDVFQGLQSDFQVPEFCSDDTQNTIGEGRLYNTMLWIGPYGCVSPLHSDPMDNVLMQFVGVKHVWLYPPNEQVYAGTEGNQKNTSPINPEKSVDLERYPLLGDVSPAIKCTLEPGDLLYIPKKWFHFVRTIETSISVNAWWR